uniref:PGG domain-containing protein n=1 Tax=Oryza meridionalis TaxID=40149 RepID=A0A0E0BXW6_9ORYZ
MAPPPPPFVYLSTTGASTLLRRAAFYGNLGLLLFSAASIPPDRCATKRLGIEKGKARDAILALNKDGIGLLHAAACQGHLNVCKFLVEELGV